MWKYETRHNEIHFLQQYFKRNFANAMNHKIILVNYNAAIVKTYELKQKWADEIFINIILHEN